MLAAESGGIPDAVSDTVATLFQNNVEWVEAALPDSMSQAERLRKAQHLVAAMQGAMMLAINQHDFKIFDNIVRDLMASIEI